MARLRVRYSMHSLDGIEVEETFDQVKEVLATTEDSHILLKQIGGGQILLHRDTIASAYPDLEDKPE